MGLDKGYSGRCNERCDILMLKRQVGVPGRNETSDSLNG